MPPLACPQPAPAAEFPEGLDVRVAAPEALDYTLSCACWLDGNTLAAGSTCLGTNIAVVLVSVLAEAIVVRVRPAPGAVAGDRAELLFQVVDSAGNSTWATRVVRYVRG